jgi:hypothetical protein
MFGVRQQIDARRERSRKSRTRRVGVLQNICSSTALTALVADFRVRRPASVSRVEDALLRRMCASYQELESLQF